MKYKHCSHVVFTELNGEIAILNSKTGIYFTLDEIGAIIWQDLKEGNTAEGLANNIVASYDVDLQTCRQDVEELLQSMLKDELIEIHNG